MQWSKRFRPSPAMVVATVALLVALAIVAALPAAAARAVSPAPDTVTRAGITSAVFQRAFTDYARNGLRLISLSGYVEDNSVHYVGLWRKGTGAEQYARAGMTEAGYTQELQARGRDGYTLVSVTPFGIYGFTRYNAIWEKRPSPFLLTRSGMTGAEYQAWFDERIKAGMHLTQVNGYTVNGQARYAAIFEGGPGAVGITHHGMTGAQLESRIDAYGRQGYRLKEISGYQDGGQDRYAAIWEKPAGGALRVRWGVPASALQRVGDVERLSGWVPIAFQGYSAGAAPRFTMLLETPFRTQDLDAISKAVNDGLRTAKVPGASVAIAKDGRLLFAAGFGKANLRTGEPMDVRHRLRIASVSKMITSAAVYKLARGFARTPFGPLALLDRKVFGATGILRDVTLPAAMKDLQGASIQQFLQHISGLPGDVYLPTNCNAGGAKGNASLTVRIQDALTRYAKDHPGRALLGKPGEVNAYSNMSHIIAEAVIEKLSGRRYADYVRSQVLAPAGLATSGPLAPALMTIGDFTGANATSGEAGHYLPDGTYAAWKAADTCGNEPMGAGAGGWAMSAVDLLRWFTSIDGKLGRVPELFRGGDLARFRTAGKPTKGGVDYYASGIDVNSGWNFCGSGTKIRQGHNGALDGINSELFEFEDGYSLAVIVNGSVPKGTCNGAAEIVKNLIDGPLKTVDWPEHDQF